MGSGRTSSSRTHRLRLVLLAMVVLTGALAPGASAADPGAGEEPTVVVAVADTGVNPYHEVYHRPENTAHPCTWVAGFDDCSIPALELSIGVYDTWQEAVAADRHIWDAVELHQWYWIPRTNIIGAVCEGSTSLTTSIGTCILDDHGHGTGTTSSVLSEVPDALLLVHEGNSGAYDLVTAPVVPDIQSHSWGPPAPIPLHLVDPILPGESYNCGQQSKHAETLFFIAAGNEAPFPTLLDCARVDNRVQVVGGGYPGSWEPSSWSAYDFASWFCRPTASHSSTTAQRARYCGTSFAAPTAAGAAAAALLALRRAEGYTGRSTEGMVSATVSREAFVQALRDGASYTPDAKYPERGLGTALPVPQQAPWLVWGYGWLDSTVVDAVVACAGEGPCPAKPAAAEDHMAQRRFVRHTTTQDAIHLPPQDDAGSGRDAGATRRTAVQVAPGKAHRAELMPALLWGDDTDWFSVSAAAGQQIALNLRGALGCWQLLDPGDEVLASGCVWTSYEAVQVGAVAPADGTYVLTYSYFAPPQEYWFSIGLDAPAPALPPLVAPER